MGSRFRDTTGRVLASSLAVGAGLVLVVVLDHRATRRELMALLRGQAAGLRETVAAAARANLEAGRQAETQLAARLLDNARLMAELDRRGALDGALLDEIVRRHELFRVSVYARDGSLERSAGGPRRGRGPRGFGGGAGAGLLPLLLAGEEQEAVSDVHASRGGQGERVAAGVRRKGGGAIVLNADASAVARLARQASLEALLADIARRVPEVCYVVFEQEGARHVAAAEGVEAPEPPAQAGPGEREVELAPGPIFEVSGMVPLPRGQSGTVRLGMRLDGVRQAERRMLAQLALTLAASLALATLGVGTAWLRRKYALLSEDHARAEEALRRRDRLAAMGELAATVAHEVRNPLNAIALGAQRLRREFLDAAPAGEPWREEMAELIDVVDGESRRVNRKVQQFLDYARPPRLDPRPTELAGLVGSVAEAARAAAAAHGVTVQTELSAAGTAIVDPDRLREAIENLVRNAVEASARGGRVAIAARSDAAGHLVEVVDDGAGIAPEALPRIFDLYFTTKPEGTGVGLAHTQQVVAAHGGTIEVDSKPGAGTRMRLRLPPRAEAGGG